VAAPVFQPRVPILIPHLLADELIKSEIAFDLPLDVDPTKAHWISILRE
jgi:hypothetical protein